MLFSCNTNRFIKNCIIFKVFVVYASNRNDNFYFVHLSINSEKVIFLQSVHTDT